MYNSIPGYGTDISDNKLTNMKFMKTHINNPFSLETWPIEYVNFVKSSLKWEAGNWSRQELLILKKKVMSISIKLKKSITLIYKI